MDLEKAYDRIDRVALWCVLGLYGIGASLLNGVKSFYEDSRVCVRVGCVMSPWLFNLYMDGVVREVNASVLGKGVKLKREREWNRIGGEAIAICG